jgi:hypothetical protein
LPDKPTDTSLLGHAVVAQGLLYGHHLKRLFPIEGYEHFRLKSYFAWKRVSWAWVQISMQVFEHPLDKDFEPYFLLRYGACSAAREPVGYGSLPELVQHSWWPFEHNFTEKLDRELKHRRRLLTMCQQELFFKIVNRKLSRLSWREAGRNLGSEDPMEDAELYPDIDVSSIPYLRRAIWGLLITTAVPIIASVYGDEVYAKDQKRIEEASQTN